MNKVTLMYSYSAAGAVAVHQRVVGPASLVRAHAASSYHLLHVDTNIITLNPATQTVSASASSHNIFHNMMRWMPAMLWEGCNIHFGYSSNGIIIFTMAIIAFTVLYIIDK